MTAPADAPKPERMVFPPGSWVNREREHNAFVSEIRHCQHDGLAMTRTAFKALARQYGTFEDFKELMSAYGPLGNRFVSDFAREQLQKGGCNWEAIDRTTAKGCRRG